MEVLQIGTQFWVVRREGDSLRLLDGPYPERYWAESASRIRELD